MKHSVAISTLVLLCLILAGCARQPARNTQTVALFQATRQGNTDMVKSLVTTQGADVNATDERGSTPLLEAARYGHEDIAALLIAAGANLKAKDNDGKTALMLAIQGDHEDVVRVLNQAGATQ
jgi:ankyrin repeat protein